jgi:septum formation protein
MDILGLAYEITPSEIDEKAIRDPDPFVLTKKLAEAKARKVASQFTDSVIVSGDAVVEKGGKVFEKPKDLDQAAAFLRELSGSTFRFITSLAVMRTDSNKMLSIAEGSEIRFRPMIDREIRDYISRYPVLRFAGAFEGDGVLRFAEHISGSCNIITGMPLCRLPIFLRELGIDV